MESGNVIFVKLMLYFIRLMFQRIMLVFVGETANDCRTVQSHAPPFDFFPLLPSTKQPIKCFCDSDSSSSLPVAIEKYPKKNIFCTQ